MSSKNNRGDRYIDEPKSGEPYQEMAQDDTWNARSQNGRAVEQLSAEEIATVLAETYFGGKVVGKEEQNEDNAMDNRSAEGAEETEAAERAREARRRKRVQEMRRRKKRQEQMRRLMLPCAVIFVVCVILAGMGINRFVKRHRRQQNAQYSEIALNVDHSDNTDTANDSLEQGSQNEERSTSGRTDESISDPADPDQVDSEQNSSKKDITYAGNLNIAGCYVGSGIADSFAEELALADTLIVRTLGGRSSEPPLSAAEDRATVQPDSEVLSENVVFIDVGEGRILGQRGANTRIPPASMTKMLTILVAAEHITDSEDTFEITRDIIDYSYINKCSAAGFEAGERVTVNDLFYGTVLPSGGEAAVALAVYVAGSQEAFVGMMNDKLEELGLSGTTHFTNCVGVYDENHYSTVYDMAVILKAAYDNSYCREVLGARTYKTSATQQHPEGLDLSNLFLRRIEDRDTHGEVLCAKTGYVVQSGNCAASLGNDKDGKIYICVTAHSNDPWLCIYDHVALYQQFLPE